MPRGDTGDKHPVSNKCSYGRAKNIASDNQSPAPDLLVVELFQRTGEGAKARPWRLKTSAWGGWSSSALEGNSSKRRKTLISNPALKVVSCSQHSKHG